jgi:hypothetical protein
MELADLKRRANAARQFDVPIEGTDVVVSMRAPTSHEAMVSYMECSGGKKSAQQARWQRALLVLAIVGWRGVCVRHVLPDAPEGADPLEFEEGAADLVLDAQGDWFEPLMSALLPHMDARQEAKDTAAKN